MAFFNKAGNILRQAASKHINHEISAAKSSIFQMIRCMPSSKLFIGGKHSLPQRESLLRLGGQMLKRNEGSPEILILFHSSGLTCNQWRKLKNLWFPGRSLFRPTSFGSGKKDFYAQLAHSAGPTCILYLTEEAWDRLEFLPSSDSLDQDLLLLYGEYRSTLVDHMDVEKASHFDAPERSLFHFYLGSSYLSVVSSPEEFDLFISNKRSITAGSTTPTGAAGGGNENCPSNHTGSFSTGAAPATTAAL